MANGDGGGGPENSEAPEFVEYPHEARFPGRIGRTLDESEAAWPRRARPPEGAPNIVVFVLDDVGYGQLSTFGGLCEAPTLDRLADTGLRYANFQTTALCSPTRGRLLTGRNHHTLGLSSVTEISLGFPAHDTRMAPEHGFLSEILVETGYNTFAVGKWHLTPPTEATAAGPFDHWPLGRGFERYYGFLGGDTDQFHPDLVHDNHYVRAPATPAEGYHLNADIADHAIDFVKDAHVNAPDKPFFLYYYATGAGHAPHQVEPEWIERYEGAFDMGWDEYRRMVHSRQRELGLVPADSELSMRDPDVTPWDDLSADAKRLYTRQMETFAGFLSQTDHHFGRVIDFIEHIGRLDNTLVICLSDNGASAEGGEYGTRNETMFFNRVPESLEQTLDAIDDWGGENTFAHYSWGWTWAGDTPFRRWKRETYRGGVTDPMVVSWPAGVDAAGEVRSQYVHVTDVTPTVLDVAGIGAPRALGGVAQSEMHGVSFAPTLDDAGAPSRHTTQYFEMFGHRSIYHDGWKAVCPWPAASLAEAAEKGRPFGMTPLTAEHLDALEADDWELYNLAEDPGECHNVAGEHPEIRDEMIRRWWVEAGRYGVLPLAGPDIARLLTPRPMLALGRKTYDFYPGGSPIPYASCPRPQNRPHSITAEVTVPDTGAQGILLAHGSRHGGYALFVKDDRLHYVHNYLGVEHFRVASSATIGAGEQLLRFEFEPTGAMNLMVGQGAPGRARLYIGAELVADGELPYTVPIVYAMAGLSCGYCAYDTLDPDVYDAPFWFTGDISRVTLDLSGDLCGDDQAEIDRIMAQQ